MPETTPRPPTAPPLLAVVVPVYNEVGLVERAVRRILDTPPPTVTPQSPERLRRVVVLVDDGSTDGTSAIVSRLGSETGVHAHLQSPNAGKGAAVRAGLTLARDTLGADVAIIHDADLEYDPADHDAVLRPILDGRADAVIGSRFLGQTHRVLYYWHYVANRTITLCSNMLTNLNLTDIECCLKAFSRPALERVRITEDRFGLEPELVARVARMRLPREDDPSRTRRARVYEVPVSYSGRTYEEGKKIGWRDGVAALVCIARYNLIDRD